MFRRLVPFLLVLASTTAALAEGPNLARSAEPTNIAVGRPTRQSSTVLGGVSGRAVDNDLDGTWPHGSVTHTTGDPGNWFEIDLGAATLVDSVVVYNRTDCCADRLNFVRVELSTTPCDVKPLGSVAAAQIGIQLDGRTSPAAPVNTLTFFTAPAARYVCLIQNAAAPLSLAEVQVYARAPAVNLARRGIARQSSVVLGAGADRAIDGNPDGNWLGNSVTHTNAGPNQWLELDLRSVQAVGTIAVMNRTDCCAARAAGVRVALSNTPCDVPNQPAIAFGTLTGESVTRLDVSGAAGRYVCLRQDGPDALSVAEIQVFAPGLEHLPASARASTTAFGAVAARVLDGESSGLWTRGAMFHSGANADGTPSDSAPWLEIDLKEPTPIGDVVIYNRTDCCTDRLAEARVELSLDPCDLPTRRLLREELVPSIGRVKAMNTWTHRYSVTVAGTVAARTQLDFIEAPRARYVCVRHDRRQFLTIAEVEVHAGVAADNLARRGTATQSTTVLGASAERAIDGWTDGTWGSGSITHSDSLAGQWWQVDLGREEQVRAIAVWNRTDCCSERLNGAVVQLTNEVCAKPEAERRIVKAASLAPRPWKGAVPWRSQLDFPDRPSGRYVCVFTAGTNPLNLAEVEVFGLGTAAFDEPPRPVSAGAATAADAVRARYAPPATADAQVGVDHVDLTVSYGGVTLPTCALVATGADTYAMTCPGLPELAMTGTLLSSSQYDLQTAQPISITAIAGALFPSLARHLDAIAPLFATTAVHLAVTNTRGFYLRGTLDLTRLPASPLTDAFATANGFLASNIPMYSRTPAFELIPSLSNGSLGVILRLTVLDNAACVIKPLSVAGAGLKYGKSTLVFALGISAGGPSVSVGFKSTAYLKPTANDAWLKVFPGVELDAGVGGAVTLKGRVSGACAASCASTCGCADVQCEGEWNPLGLKTVTLKQGYLELGVATTGIALPIVTMAFDHAKLGTGSDAVEGSYAVSFDFGPAKAFGFQLAANRMPILPLLGLLGVGDVLPAQLAINNPVLSFSTTGLALFNVTVPSGFRLRGGVDLGLVHGSIDASLGSSLTDLSKLGSVSSLASFGMPSGSLRFELAIADLPSMILRSSVLSMLARPILERTFWLSSVSLELGVGGNTSVGADVRFKLLGSAHTFNVSASVALDPAALANTIATRTKSLIIDPVSGAVVAAYTAVKAAAEAAAAAAATLATGGTVVINGVVTVGSTVVNAVSDPDSYKKIYNWIPGT
ncbi:MAG: discoidin domain-containing protein [Proteobacteria bacterium]|nr:discoidin domain-containing protein [Pseudomonadota bacterium]